MAEYGRAVDGESAQSRRIVGCEEAHVLVGDGQVLDGEREREREREREKDSERIIVCW